MSQVSLVRCDQYEPEHVRSAVRKAFDLIGGLECYVKKGMTVALKPNLLTMKSPNSAAVTHPELIRAVALEVQRLGAKAIVIESPGGPYTRSMLKAVYTACGVSKVAKESNIELNYDTASVDIENPNGLYLKKTTIIKPLLDADVIIDLPKLKTHGQMLYTGAVKNMFGAVPGVLKADYHLRQWHYDDFANALIDIYLSVKPQVIVMDAMMAMEGAGPSAGTPRKVGLILAGFDGFDVDLLASSIIGVDPNRIPVLAQAIKRNLCKKEASFLQVVGICPDSAKVKNFKTPPHTSDARTDFTSRSLAGRLSRLFAPYPKLSASLCNGCGVCAKSCPPHIIKMTDQRPVIDYQRCIRCFCCQELCPKGAMRIRRNPLASWRFLNGVDEAIKREREE